MIVLDTTPVTEPTRPEPPPKRKKLVTAAMKAASRANAQKSTGPKPESTARTRMNAAKHLQTCTHFLFLPHESVEAFEAQVALWVRRLGARTEPEIDQVRTAVYNELKASRAQ